MLWIVLVYVGQVDVWVVFQVDLVWCGIGLWCDYGQCYGDIVVVGGGVVLFDYFGKVGIYFVVFLYWYWVFVDVCEGDC